MELSFYKYQGTGNDFVMVDNRSQVFPQEDLEVVERLCSRKFGIGSDGLILINSHPSTDFEMVFYNPDGSKSLCGNGARCAVRFAHDLGIIGSKTTFMAYDGAHDAEVSELNIRLKMHNVESIATHSDGFYADTGSPHFVQEAKDLELLDLQTEGKKLRYDDRFQPNGTNVNFIQKLEEDAIQVRTYERGVENETLSCGTGVTAAALCAAELGIKTPVKVSTKGGDLVVEFKNIDNEGYTEVFLSGPAVHVFNGTVII